MSDFAPQVRRHWFVAARSDAIQGKPTRAFLLGWPIVLVRHQSGTVIALEDLCPHRGVPLSDGRLSPLGLACRYHGWTFDHAGRCTAMPGMAEPPLGDVRVAAFLVVERSGLIWVGRSADCPLPARFTAMDSGRLRFVQHAKWSLPVVDSQLVFFEAVRAQRGDVGDAVKAAKAVGRTKAVEGARAVQAIGAGRAAGETLPSLAESRFVPDNDGFKIEYEVPARARAFGLGVLRSAASIKSAYFSSLNVAQVEYRFSRHLAIWISVCFTPETLVSTQLFATVHVEGRWLLTGIARAVISSFFAALEEQSQQLIDGPGRALGSSGDIRSYLEAVWFGNGDTASARTPQ